MAGEQFDGSDPRNFVPKNSQAFCDGMRHRAADTAANNPLTDNPEDGLGSDFESAWDAGWAAADDEAGGSISKDEAGCCNLAGTAVSA
ncbi:unnamed protein product [marine sediment metagenome]|uniref:Uncharacterized protein n=1 Tax=marine sediment metagenome TaxID=412755 RepID=X0WLF1_9ZZZZ